MIFIVCFIGFFNIIGILFWSFSKVSGLLVVFFIVKAIVKLLFIVIGWIWWWCIFIWCSDCLGKIVFIFNNVKLILLIIYNYFIIVLVVVKKKNIDNIRSNLFV